MDKFRTTVEIPESVFKLDYRTPCFLSGSCFTENIGRKMAEYKLPVKVNPFGVLYNPSSLSSNLRILMSRHIFSGDELEYRDGLWVSLDHHSSFSGSDKDRTLENINRSAGEAGSFLKNCSVLLLTFGTAWVYIYNRSNRVAANCHKIHRMEFTRRLLSVEEIVTDYTGLLDELKNYNPSLKIIFTISPVRHFSDGAFNNQLSKSILFVAVNELLKKYDFTGYFPAYEIFMDELRDYRFYATDMLHPSEQGITYVWERFADTWIDPETQDIMAEVEKINRAVSHRPFRVDTHAYLKFVEASIAAMEKLEQKFPFLSFSDEKRFLADR